MATGTTSAHGAGRGWTTRPGALRHITMAAGHTLGIVGAGARVLIMRGQFMDRRLSASLAARTGALDLVLAADSGAASVGSRWVRANAIARGIARATRTTAT